MTPARNNQSRRQFMRWLLQDRTKAGRRQMYRYKTWEFGFTYRYKYHMIKDNRLSQADINMWVAAFSSKGK